MDDWYRYYKAEINRRGDEIKAAEKYRLMELAKNDPYRTPEPKFYQRLFSALGTLMSRWGTRARDQQPTLRQDYVRDKP